MINHPLRKQLLDYVEGKLDPDEAQDVETHIADCDLCGETLANIPDDTFVELLRRSDAVELPADNAVERNVGNLPHVTASEPTHSIAPASSATDLDLPARLQDHPRYRIVELVGRGGMGDVYKAEHKVMKRTVALKLINRELVENPQAVERFRREVCAAGQLEHPNIVTAHDAEQVGDLHFLVMEFVEGTDLDALVKEKGPLAVKTACDLIRQAAIGLQFAHESKIVHRDIKPHNLMKTGDGTLKILDFGLAALTTPAIAAEASKGEGQARSGKPPLTTMSTVMGTPGFISPEQAADPRSADIRSDIYSLGCTFYYLLAGRVPFADGDVMEKVKAHTNQQPEPLENVRGGIPVKVAEVVRRMMAKKPSDRFQTAAEVADSLKEFAAPKRPLRRVVVFVILLLLIGLGITEITGVTAIAPTIIRVVRGEGVLTVEFSEPDVEVLIDGNRVQLKSPRDQVDIVVGKHQLKVSKSGFHTFTKEFTIRRDGREIIRVTLRPKWTTQFTDTFDQDTTHDYTRTEDLFSGDTTDKLRMKWN
ncbi:MAG: protein kinase, partial [Planctomycetes bacterium]|nr:protein kinase [Planctomycetota bacterium]